MSYVSIQDQVQVIFQQSTSKYVIHKDNKKPSLTKIKTLPINETVTIDIIKDIMKGIIYVQQKMITYKPTQIFKEHIVRNEQNWAIINIICYRNKLQKSWQGDYNKYNPQDYDYHLDEQNQLVWHIGSLWFQLITKERLPSIAQMNQDELDILISKKIKNVLIVSILKTVLVIEKQKRISFAELMVHSIFETQALETEASLINFISKINVIGKMNKNVEPFNPFQEKIFQRDLKQALAIGKLFDKVKLYIKDRFDLQDLNQIQFSLYLIDLKLYFRMKIQQQERIKKRFNIVLLQQKQHYSNFAKKLLQLQNAINRKRKKTKFSKFKSNYGSTLCSINQMIRQDVYKHFKSYLVSYAKLLAPHRKDPKYLRWIIAILLVRCSDYVFSNSRKYLFSDFIEEGKVINIEQIIQRITTSDDLHRLKSLEKKIIQFYFT